MESSISTELRPGRQGPAKQSYALVNDIFGRMLLRYGSQWLSRWDGMPLEHVKEDWRGQLAGLTREQIEHGLAHLPEGRTPDAGMFRSICREHAAPEVADPAERKRLAIERRKHDEETKVPLRVRNPELADEIEGKLKALNLSMEGKGARERAHANFKRLRELEKAGHPLTDAQRVMWRDGLRHIDDNVPGPAGGNFDPAPLAKMRFTNPATGLPWGDIVPPAEPPGAERFGPEG